MNLSELQLIIKDRYIEFDKSRGLDQTFIWFMEEVGELASAVAHRDKNNAKDEIGDVLMWLVSIVNLFELSLDECVQEYLIRNKIIKPK